MKFTYYTRFLSALFSSMVLFAALSSGVQAADKVSIRTDIVQGFNFQKDQHKPFGFITHLSIAGQEYPKSLKTYNAEEAMHVNGVISNIRWSGKTADPVTFTAQVLADARETAAMQTHTELSDTSIRLSFVVYTFDEAANHYKLAFQGTDVRGLIEKNNGQLEFEIDNEPGTVVQSPRNFELYLSVMPEDGQKQQLMVNGEAHSW